MDFRIYIVPLKLERLEKMKIAPINYCQHKISTNQSIKTKNESSLNQQPAFGVSCTWDDRVLNFVVHDLPELEKTQGKVKFIKTLQQYFKEITDSDFMQKLRTKGSDLFNEEEELRLSVADEVENREIQKPIALYGKALSYSLLRPEVEERTIKTGHLWWKKSIPDSKVKTNEVLSYVDKGSIQEAWFYTREKGIDVSKDYKIPEVSVEEQAKRIKDNYLKIREELLKKEELEILNEKGLIEF